MRVKLELLLTLTFILKCYTIINYSISILVYNSVSIKSRRSSQCHLFFFKVPWFVLSLCSQSFCILKKHFSNNHKLIPPSMHHHPIARAQKKHCHKLIFRHFMRSLDKVPPSSSHLEACVLQREPITKRQLIWEMAKRGHGFDRGSLTP